MDKNILLLSSDPQTTETQSLQNLVQQRAWIEAPSEKNWPPLDGLILSHISSSSPLLSLVKFCLDSGRPVLITTTSITGVLHITPEKNINIGVSPHRLQEVREHFPDADLIACPDDDYVTDREHKVISTPGASSGLNKALREFMEMA